MSTAFVPTVPPYSEDQASSLLYYLNATTAAFQWELATNPTFAANWRAALRVAANDPAWQEFVRIAPGPIPNPFSKDVGSPRNSQGRPI